jgi:hypothetical protein
MPFDNPHENPFGDLELLMDARGRISNPTTWIRGRYQDGDRHCLVAALSMAAGSRHYKLPNRTERRLARLLATQLPQGRPFFMTMVFVSARQWLIWFNDNPRTRHEDVMALFDRTIHQLASEVPQHVST